MQSTSPRTVVRSPLRGRLLAASMLAQEATSTTAAERRQARAQETAEELTRVAREWRQFRLDWETWNPQRATLVRATRSAEFRGLLSQSEDMAATLQEFAQQHGSYVAPRVLDEVRQFFAWLQQLAKDAESFWAGVLEDLREDADELAAEAEEWAACDNDPATQVEPFELSA